MDAGKNPFAPGAGTQPPELTGRDENLNRAGVILDRVKAGRSERSSMLIGLRGVGKTVLLNRMQRMAEERGFQTALIEAPEGRSLAELLAPPLRQILLRLDLTQNTKEKLRKARTALQSFASTFKVNIGEIGIEVSAPSGTADSGVLERDITDLLVAVGEAAAESSAAVAIFIDELQYVSVEELGALFAGIHRVGQLNLPLVLMGAGLPQLAGLSGEAKSYAERLFAFQNIGPLSESDAKNALREPIEREGASVDEEALVEMVKATEGYPYFLQEWGLHTWNQAETSEFTKDDVSRAEKMAIAALDESFFRVRFDRLTKGEKEYLRAMSELGKGPHRSGDIAEKLGRPVQQVAPVRAKIISKGMIFAPGHGDTAFTVPKFDEYMRRVMPEFIPHISKKKE
jgi:Cdc6-like AAA superfamily ATPase